MIIYRVNHDEDDLRYKKKYRDMSSILCLEVPDNILDDCMALALHHNDVYVDLKVGLSVCSHDDDFKSGVGMRLARKRLLSARALIDSIYVDTRDRVYIGLKFQDKWIHDHITWIKVAVYKTNRQADIVDISYEGCREAEDYKAILESEDYKKTLMDIAIEQSLRGE